MDPAFNRARVPTFRLPAGLLVFLAMAAFSARIFAKDHSIPLEFTVASESFGYLPMVAEKRTQPFSNEPAAEQVRGRGVLRLDGVSTPGIAYLWSKAGVVLDCNRNENLADDGPPLAGRYNYDNYAYFTNVVWIVGTNRNGTTKSLLIDFYLRTGQGPVASGRLRSYWSGKLDIDGESWQVGRLDGTGSSRGSSSASYLLVRPWVDRERAFTLDLSDPTTVSFPQQLFLQGKQFKVTMDTEAWQGGTLQLREEKANLGPLTVTGENVYLLRLASSDSVVLLLKPGKSAMVPIGTYTGASVQVGSGEVRAQVGSSSWRAREIEIKPASNGTVTIGGPLTNACVATVQGHFLRLNYKLLGGAGLEYELSTVDRSKPPEFKAFRDGREVGSGKFQYG